MRRPGNSDTALIAMISGSGLTYAFVHAENIKKSLQSETVLGV